jgi:hypothetical protein
MVRTSIQVLVPPAVESPRGAQWAANAAISIARVVFCRGHRMTLDPPSRASLRPACAGTEDVPWKP